MTPFRKVLTTRKAIALLKYFTIVLLLLECSGICRIWKRSYRSSGGAVKKKDVQDPLTGSDARHYPNARKDAAQFSCETQGKAQNENTSPLLTLFTTMVDSEDKVLMNSITIRNWAQFGVMIKPVLFHTDMHNELAQDARKNGWNVLEINRTNRFGTPVFKDMFIRVRELYNSTFHGFSNGDILFDRSLLRTLKAVAKLQPPYNSTMVVGERSNFNVTTFLQAKYGQNIASHMHVLDIVNANGNFNQNPPWCGPEISWIAKNKAEPFRSDAMDYFLLSNHPFPWDELLDVVVGRPGYDDYFHVFAKDHGTFSVDASKTLHAVHQTGPDGNFAGARGKPDARYNKRIIKAQNARFNYNVGGIYLAKMFTYYHHHKLIIARRSYQNKVLQTTDILVD